MRTDDFDFDLPTELIAQCPAAQRSASRLLRVDGAARRDAQFGELPGLLRAGDVLVFNDTRVINARLSGVKDSGGKVEALVERVLDARHVLAFLRASHAPRPGAMLRLEDALDAAVVERRGELYRLRFAGDTPVIDLLARYGRLPLPPYITHAPAEADAIRYQTVYARHPGAVAAPTAGLHFDEAMLAEIARRGVTMAYVTLHVGAGTFQPVRAARLADHRMHHERYVIPQAAVDAIQAAQAADGRIMAVGTTSLRALEAAARGGALRAGEGETDLFITPGYRFQIVERLLTNFHLPKSTLLMLVSAFGGMDNIRRAYRHAVAGHYRFFSYGDAMLIERQSSSHGQ